MAKFNRYDPNYLTNKPKVIRWQVIAGNRRLSPLESYDVVFDEYDLKIRKLDVN